VALKVLLQAHHHRPELKRRFLDEAQILGQLQHPGIPPVHDLGELPDGRPFFAMKLIQGRTLAELLRERLSPSHDLPRFLGIFGQLCQTVAYAHSRGILHRDLKPSNIMVGAFGEVQVMDWGLAKVLPGEGHQPEPPREETREGMVLGTPAYMAPEQACGEIERLDERGDVFGLGAILCVILTGQPPYVGRNLLGQAAQGALAGALERLDGSGADVELVTLAKRCLAAAQEERPRCAGEVAEALAAYQAGVQERLRQAELARSRAEVKAQEERKRRRLTVALAVSLLLLLGGAALAGWWYQHQEAQQALRQERAVVEATAALQEGGKLRERALTVLDNPESWQANLESARSALKRAQAALQQEPQLAATALAKEVQQLQVTLDQDGNDLRLVLAFEAVRFKESDFDPRYRDSGAFADVQRALGEWGLPLATVPPERVTALLQQRPREMQDQLVAMLHYCLSRVPPAQKDQKEWLRKVLLTADPDPWRQQVRQAVANADAALLAKLVDTVELARQPPALLVQLAQAPLLHGKSVQLVLLRRAQEAHPHDFWLNFNVAQALYRSVFPNGSNRGARDEKLPLLHEAIRFDTAALVLRPRSPAVHNNLGTTLSGLKDLEEAIFHYRKAMELDPRYVPAPYNLGLALKDKKDMAGAIACFKKALELEPNYAQAHCNLGVLLAAQGDEKEAIACYHKALKIDPKLVEAHVGLGNVLAAKKDWVGAMGQYHKALEIDPKYTTAHGAIANALHDKGELTEAITWYRKVIELHPISPVAHYNLGVMLAAKKDWAAAIVCYHEALKLDPTYAEAHCNLGHALREQGKYVLALEALRRGHELGSKRPSWEYPSEKWVKECQRLIELDRDLPDILAGKKEPADPAELMEFALFGTHRKNRFVEVAELFQRCFLQHPSWVSGTEKPRPRYYAAATAAMAARREGVGVDRLDEAACGAWRDQARRWLRAELDAWAAVQKRGAPAELKALREAVQYWRKDGWLSGVFDKKALAKLPEAERTAWQQLWDDVEALLTKAQAKE
jgi:tetratricopeptide (TPR) repeat protein